MIPYLYIQIIVERRQKMQFGIWILITFIGIGIKLITTIIKGVYHLINACRNAYKNNDKYLYKNAPREEQEAINELRSMLEHSDGVIVKNEDLMVKLSNLYEQVKTIDMEALLIQAPANTSEENRKAEAETKLLDIRRKMYELVKFQCNSLTEEEKDLLWKESWHGTNSSKATNEEKLNHATTYLKNCLGKLSAQGKASIDAQLASVNGRNKFESKNHENELVK